MPWRTPVYSARARRHTLTDTIHINRGTQRVATIHRFVAKPNPLPSPSIAPPASRHRPAAHTFHLCTDGGCLCRVLSTLQHSRRFSLWLLLHFIAY